MFPPVPTRPINRKTRKTKFQSRSARVPAGSNRQLAEPLLVVPVSVALCACSRRFSGGNSEAALKVALCACSRRFSTGTPTSDPDPGRFSRALRVFPPVQSKKLTSALSSLGFSRALRVFPPVHKFGYLVACCSIRFQSRSARVPAGSDLVLRRQRSQ